MNRSLAIELASGDALDVRQLQALESLSTAFRLDVVARSSDAAIDVAAVVGQKARVEARNAWGSRAWEGVVARMELVRSEPSGLSTYAIQVAPTAWLMTQRRSHRAFVHRSIPDIVATLLGEWDVPFEKRLQASYSKLPLRVQYGESDFDFLRRLLAEAGITFWFEWLDDATRLVLSDAPHAREAERLVPYVADDSAALGRPHVTDVAVRAKVVPTRAARRDFDFRRPRYGLEGQASRERGAHPLLEDYRYAPGQSLSDAGESHEPLGDAEGAYRHSDDRAADRAKIAHESLGAGELKIHFATSLVDLAPGSVLRVAGHPHPELAEDRALLVSHGWLSCDVDGAWSAGGQALPTRRPFRPSTSLAAAHEATTSCDPFEPLRAIAKPRIWGVQSALVTGPEGEDVHTDEHGRIKLQFAWDREGRFDGASSPWVRVSQPWAGAGFGAVNLPRVGQEVLVTFLDGDPDHPVVVGRMFNATAPSPYALPEHKRRTSLKSDSKAGANELTLDDTDGAELFYVQAQHDLHKIVRNDELEHTQGSRHVQVDGDLVLAAKGNVVIHAGGELVIKGGPNVKINPSGAPKPPRKPRSLSSK